MSDDRVQISVRVPKFWVGKVDALALKLSRPGFPARRADALRVVLERGMETLTEELKTKKGKN